MDITIVNGLVRKRRDLVTALEAAENSVTQLSTDIAQVDAVLRIFDPQIDLAGIKSRRLKPFTAAHGALSRAVTTALRESKTPVSIRDLVTTVAPALGLDPENAVLAEDLYGRVSGVLYGLKSRGLARSARGPGVGHVWTLVD